MNKSAFPILFALGFLLSAFTPASGQMAGSDSSSTSRAVAHAKTVYHRTLGPQEHLFSGSEYVELNMPRRGHPFHKAREWEEGDIFFDGILYPNIPMLYDVLRDQVVISHASEDNIFVKIKLNNDRIGYFDFMGDIFVQASGQTASGTSLTPGLYHQLYDGKVGVVAKRVKTRQDVIESQMVIAVFTSKDRYYILKEGLYYPVKSKGSVMQVFKEHKKELARHLRKNQIKFRENREAAIISLAKHYDALQEQP
jgi:hypothetical protein